MNLSPPVAKRLGCWLADFPGRGWSAGTMLSYGGYWCELFEFEDIEFVDRKIESRGETLEAAVVSALDIALGADEQKTEPANERPEVADG